VQPGRMCLHAERRIIEGEIFDSILRPCCCPF
jgi:hypothetical protein